MTHSSFEREMFGAHVRVLEIGLWGNIKVLHPFITLYFSLWESEVVITDFSQFLSMNTFLRLYT
jgi:hypothetical protein